MLGGIISNYVGSKWEGANHMWLVWQSDDSLVCSLTPRANLEMNGQSRHRLRSKNLKASILQVSGGQIAELVKPHRSAGMLSRGKKSSMNGAE